MDALNPLLIRTSNPFTYQSENIGCYDHEWHSGGVETAQEPFRVEFVEEIFPQI